MEDDLQAQQEEEEDFSFPSILGNSPCSMDSPPWLYSPLKPTSLEGGRDEGTESRVKEEEAQEKSLGIVSSTLTLRDGSREDKMDMLWEDFNEELWGSSTNTEKRNSPSGDYLGKVTVLSKGSNKGGGGGGRAVAFVKALRKLFLLRKGVAPSPIKARRHRSQR